jgi:hypothetical protein
MLGPDNVIWDDGEWVSWDEINQQIQYKEWRVKYPNADLSLVTVFESLIRAAQEYYEKTGKSLRVYGDIGEMFGAITYGIRLHKDYAEGSDGLLGDDFVEVKTITPFKKCDSIAVKLSGHFSKLLVVKINKDFEVAGRLVDRKKLPTRNKKILRIKWDALGKLV